MTSGSLSVADVEGMGCIGGGEITEDVEERCFAAFSSRSCFSFSSFNLDNNGSPAPIGEIHFSPSLLPDVVVSPLSYNINIYFNL